MPQQSLLETRHGVLMNIAGQGIFIMGPAGIGKSSLALEFLQLGHQLIADDIAEFSLENHIIVGRCPTLLTDLLHTRELGLIKVSECFGKKAWQTSTPLDYIIELHSDSIQSQPSLTPDQHVTVLCQQPFPTLKLTLNNPASLSTRILTWLKIQNTSESTAHTFIKQQRRAMAK